MRRILSTSAHEGFALVVIDFTTSQMIDVSLWTDASLAGWVEVVKPLEAGFLCWISPKTSGGRKQKERERERERERVHYNKSGSQEFVLLLVVL